MQNRNGITAIELMVSAVSLLTIISVVSTLGVRINGVWKDIGHRRVAVCELSNQLEKLTRLPAGDLENELASLEPSEHCLRSLRNAKLQATTEADALGTRIVLSLNWDRRHPGKAVQLAAWLPMPKEPAPKEPMPNDSEDESESSDE